MTAAAFGRGTRVTAPKSELLVCSVHIASFASQTFVVTYQ